ncbi:MAG TPA: hypothetical protein VFC78_08380 [Tepidisphaeraceae bacterium]|nr:hypothetical protein [Tepidisphaeraceae bacterium]
MNKTTKRALLTASSFMTMSDAQKEAIYQECEKIGPDSGTPLTRSEQRLHARFLRKAARPPSRGEGAARIQATMERGLLRRADAYARRHGMSRSQLIARGIREVLAAK